MLAQKHSSPSDRRSSSSQSRRVDAGSRPAAHATTDYARRCLRPTLDDVNLEGRQSKLGCSFVRLTPCGLAVDSLATHRIRGGSSTLVTSPWLFGSCGGMTARAHPSRLSSVSRW